MNKVKDSKGKSISIGDKLIYDLNNNILVVENDFKLSLNGKVLAYFDLDKMNNHLTILEES